MGQRGRENEVGFSSMGQDLQAKSHGGLWLHDPETLSRVSGAKLWWRWIKEPNAPWAKLWEKNYAKYCRRRITLECQGK